MILSFTVLDLNRFRPFLIFSREKYFVFLPSFMDLSRNLVQLCVMIMANFMANKKGFESQPSETLDFTGGT